jgi:hypothetical protein
MDKLIVPIQQNKPWTEEDDRRLMEMRASGRSIASVSAALRRSAGAVSGRIAVLRSRAKKAAYARPVANSQPEGLA